MVSITEQRAEILNLIAPGWTNQQIADRYSVNIETIKTTIKLIYRALGARNRAHAVAIAHRQGIIDRNARGRAA